MTIPERYYAAGILHQVIIPFRLQFNVNNVGDPRYFALGKYYI